MLGEQQQLCGLYSVPLAVYFEHAEAVANEQNDEYRRTSVAGVLEKVHQGCRLRQILCMDAICNVIKSSITLHGRFNKMNQVSE